MLGWWRGWRVKGLCPAVVTPAGRGTAGMRGSVRQGRERKGRLVLVLRGLGGRGVIRRQIFLENQEDFSEQVCWVLKKENVGPRKISA